MYKVSKGGNKTKLTIHMYKRCGEHSSLGSRRISKHVLGNPRLCHTGKRCTQLIMRASMLQKLVQMRRFRNSLGRAPQGSNSRRTSATTSKKARISRGLRGR